MSANFNKAKYRLLRPERRELNAGFANLKCSFSNFLLREAFKKKVVLNLGHLPRIFSKKKITKATFYVCKARTKFPTFRPQQTILSLVKISNRVDWLIFPMFPLNMLGFEMLSLSALLNSR